MVVIWKDGSPVSATNPMGMVDIMHPATGMKLEGKIIKEGQGK